MASLDRIEIEGYRSIKKLKLCLKAINILIGANGAGKSNLGRVWSAR
jgi:predicted ATPase